MSTATLTSLLDYLTGALTTDNKQWLADHLYQQVRENESPVPYTMEEIDTMLREAEDDYAAGRYKTYDEVFGHKPEQTYILYKRQSNPDCSLLGLPSGTEEISKRDLIPFSPMN